MKLSTLAASVLLFSSNLVWSNGPESVLRRFTLQSVQGLGDVWIDRGGRAWGEISPEDLTYPEAVQFCERQGARVPEIHDFQRLRRYLTDRNGVLQAQVLPNFVFEAEDGHQEGYAFWTSNTDAFQRYNQITYNLLSGVERPVSALYTQHPVRCIAR